MKQPSNPVTDTGSSSQPTARLIRISEVQKMTGLSRSYVYELTRRGLFPQSVPLVPGGKAMAWVEIEVREWITTRLADRDLRGAK